MSDWVDLVGIVSLGVNSVFVNCFGDYVYCLFNWWCLFYPLFRAL